MTARKLRAALLLLSLAAGTPLPAAENFEATLDKAALTYAERLRAASAELAATRERIAREKAPLLEAQRAAEDRLLAAESEFTRSDTLGEQLANNRRRLVREAEALHKNSGNLVVLARDALKSATDGLAPGEEALLAEKLAGLSAALNGAPAGGAGDGATGVAEFLFARVRQSLGGYTAPGNATAEEGGIVQAGTFAFVGPQTFFLPAGGGPAGIAVRRRDDVALPVTYPVPGWTDAAALFRGDPGVIVADATGGKALRLKQTSGSLREHIAKGGPVAYAILAVGLLAGVIVLQKLLDLRRLAVDDAATVKAFLQKVAEGGRAAAASAAGTLRAATREVFVTGLQHMDGPKVALEEHLQATLLQQRLHFERRLPLLAVIATAAPLMGLLGTVVGMVKTFALITVFGTGNAGKLASGISEVLVATELGLAVAIPTLVIHGFLAQRIHRRLATLERQALQFVTAAKSDREAALV
jgi:biopolymer transport protein ExbB